MAAGAIARIDRLEATDVNHDGNRSLRMLVYD